MLKKIKRNLKQKIKNLILNALKEHPNQQNIKLGLQLTALNSTIKYVHQNMKTVNSFSSKNFVLEYGFKHCQFDGLVLEFGVYEGFTINLIADFFCTQIVYGFDSFEGLPENWRAGFPEGTFRMLELPKVNRNVQLIKGWFEDTLPLFIESKKENIAFLHIDCDLYSSTKTIFDLFGSRITKGTVIVFDEYFNYPGWEHGEFKAFQEFIQEKNLKYEYLTYNNMHEQVAVIIR